MHIIPILRREHVIVWCTPCNPQVVDPIFLLYERFHVFGISWYSMVILYDINFDESVFARNQATKSLYTGGIICLNNWFSWVKRSILFEPFYSNLYGNWEISYKHLRVSEKQRNIYFCIYGWIKLSFLFCLFIFGCHWLYYNYLFSKTNSNPK